MTDSTNLAETHKDQLQAAMQSGKAAGALRFIAEFATIDERAELYRLAQRLVGRSNAPDLDMLIEIVQAGIKDCMAASDAAAAADPDGAARIKDMGNRASYNLSADLAECWPGDETPRTDRHFHTGLAAADDCIRWREDLKKEPWSFSMAWWARGAHLLSLGRAADAERSFGDALRYAELACAAKDGDPRTDFGCLLARGYVGLAQAALGRGYGPYDAACSAFRVVTAEGGEKGDDARFGIDQLETMRRRLAARDLLS